MTPAQSLVYSTARWAAILGALGGLVANMLVGPRAALSSVAGTILGAVNLWVLAKLITTLFNEHAPKPTRLRTSMLLGLKGIALVVIVGVLIVGRVVIPLAFVSGLTLSAIATVVAGMNLNNQNTDDSSSNK